MKKYTTLFVGITAFIYYAILSAKSWTWIFVSSDSGDWLICANQWFLPQAYGSPLYILLMRLIGLVTDGNATVITATILLSCLPSAVTVMLVYLIVHRLTDRAWCAVTSSLVLLGCGVFLSQSTVLEEYALAIMFPTLAYFFYIQDKRKLTTLCLGLGVAVHIFVLPITVFWLVLEYKQWRLWLVPSVIFVAVGAVSYSLVPILMHLDGNLSLANLWMYWTGTTGAVVGTLSIFDTPTRILAVASVLLMSFGLALVPLYFGLKRPYDAKKLVLLTIVVVSLWYHLTSLDPVSWTFLNFGIPSTVVLVGMGLSRLTIKHTYVVTAGAIVLVCVNSVFLNANILTNENPIATAYYSELMNLPNESVIACTGVYAFGVLYVMSEVDKSFTILSTEEQVRKVLGEDRDVYFAGPPNKMPAFELMDMFDYTMIRKVEGIR